MTESQQHPDIILAQAILEALALPAFAVDGAGTVVAWTDGATALTGRSASEMMGRRARTVFHRRSKPTPLDEVLAGEGPSEEVLPLAGANRAKAKRIHLRVVPVAGEAGGLRAIATLAPDPAAAAEPAPEPVLVVVADAPTVDAVVESPLEVAAPPAAIEDAALVAGLRELAAGVLDGPEVPGAHGAALGELRGVLCAFHADVAAAATALADGRLSERCERARHPGAFGEAIAALHRAADCVTAPLEAATHFIGRLAEGEIAEKITERYEGDYNRLKNALNLSVDTLNMLVVDVSFLTIAAYEGTLSTRVDAERHGGDFRRIIESVNNTLDLVTGPITVAASYVARIAKGDIPTKIAEEYNGDFAVLRDNLNACIDAVNALVADSQYLAASAVMGELTTRADASQHGGDFRRIVEGVNATLDAVIGPLTVAAQSVARIAEGDIPPRIEAEYNGDFAVLRDNLNRCIDAIGALVADSQELAEAAVDGELTARADASRHGGDFARIVEGVNATLDAVTEPMSVAAAYVARIARGDIPPRIQDAYQGEFATLRDNLNTCIDAVNALVRDTQQLATAAVEGRLATRADATRHGGEFRRIIEGVNGALDAIVAPIEATTSVLERLAERDLTARVTSDFPGDYARIKVAANAMAGALDETLGQVAEAVKQLNAAAGEIAASSQSVADGASRQAASLEETSSSLEQMASMTRQNAESTHRAKALAESSRAAADECGTAMHEMNDAMVKIRASSENTAAIIRDINEIAFQTNLLALNAAVEAARAGDAGRGFAVVADEVRNLAQRAKEAARRTEELIRQSVKLADGGATVSHAASSKLDTIVVSVRKVTEIVAEIAAASSEQARGIELVNRAVSSMDEVTQQSAANAEQSSSAAEELSGQAQELASMVSRFQLGTQGPTRAAAPPPPRAPARPAAPPPPPTRRFGAWGM